MVKFRNVFIFVMIFLSISLFYIFLGKKYEEVKRNRESFRMLDIEDINHLKVINRFGDELILTSSNPLFGRIFYECTNVGLKGNYSEIRVDPYVCFFYTNKHERFDVEISLTKDRERLQIVYLIPKLELIFLSENIDIHDDIKEAFFYE